MATHAQPPREVVAVDYSTTAVRMAREHALAHHIDGIAWGVGDIQSIQTPMDKLAVQAARKTPGLARAAVRLGNAVERRRAKTRR